MDQQSPPQLLECSQKEAALLYEKNRYKEVENIYSKLIGHLSQIHDGSSQDVKKTLAVAYNNRGHSKYMQVCFDDAIEDYNEALHYDDALAVSYYNRGTIRYRLCVGMSEEGDAKLELLCVMLQDFKNASTIDPDNLEYKIGLANAEKEYENLSGDGNALPKNKFPVKWSKISTPKLIKLLFLLDNGDQTTFKKEVSQDKNAEAVKEATIAFLSFLQSKDRSIIVDVLQKRVQELLEYPVVIVQGNNEAVNLSVRKQDEDLLTFVEACYLLGIECHSFDKKKEKVQQKLFLNEIESQGSLFMHAENLRMNGISDRLSHNLVHELYRIVTEDENLNKMMDQSFDVSSSKLHKVEGLKEALFFYIIRFLEYNEKLNRIYTSKLEDLLDKLSRKASSKVDAQSVQDIIGTLSTYPFECRPAGHCIVFCVTKERDGACGEISKVKEVFENSLGYTVKVEEDPTYETLNTFIQELSKEKYRFYDALVIWFMAHGTEKTIELSDGVQYETKTIIDKFSKLDNFRRKPKIFFMASCQGKTAISVKREGGIKVAVDGGSKGTTTFSVIPENVCNITAVYYEMDRLIAHATLPNKYAFRIPHEGSVYVDTVCRLLEKHRGVNITEVLEKASNKMHQILFLCASGGTNFQGEAKQACYYESTFQKTFRVPTGFENK